MVNTYLYKESQMDVEKAIKTAIEYEIKVRDVYAEAIKAASDDIGKKLFKLLADEEQHHVDYLNSRLAQWHKEGNLSAERLDTAIPDRKTIEGGIRKLKGHIKGAEKSAQVQLLQKALDVEMATSNFYNEMVGQMQAEPRKMFARFLEIEEGHQAIVKAEIDALTGTGVWFDFIEFDLEANN
jgi:rubrerythrin